MGVKFGFLPTVEHKTDVTFILLMYYPAGTLICFTNLYHRITTILLMSASIFIEQSPICAGDSTILKKKSHKSECC
jgi:hypothetical protein